MPALERRDAAEHKMFAQLSRHEAPATGRRPGTRPMSMNQPLTASMEPMILGFLKRLEESKNPDQRKLRDRVRDLWDRVQEISVPLEKALSEATGECDHEGRALRRDHVTSKEVDSWDLKPETRIWLRSRSFWTHDRLSGELHLYLDTLVHFVIKQTLDMVK